MVNTLSSAAAFPFLGSFPAPNPLVNFSPNNIFSSDFTANKCLASVFAATVRGPEKSDVASLLMALHPAPPTPTAIMLFFVSPIKSFKKASMFFADVFATLFETVFCSSPPNSLSISFRL